ncbi:MAG: MoaD family protein [bacterium]
MKAGNVAMSNVTVRYYATLRNCTGREEDSLAAARVRDVIAFVKKHYGGGADRILRHCSVFVNSSNVTFLDGAGTRLKDGDQVHIFPPLGGG